MARDAASVITDATEEIVQALADDYEVSLPRMYEMLGRQCFYPKTKVLIRRIAAHNQEGARLIKADLMAMFDDILDPVTETVTDAEMHEQLNDAVQARLRDAPRAIRLRENREALEVLSRDIADLEQPVVPVRQQMQEAIERRNGQK